MVTASASEINYVDVAPGAGTASKALVLDAMKSISGINSLTATDLTGMLQTAAQPNVTSVGTLISLAVAGDITIGSTTLSGPEVAVLDAVTPGVVSASKALVVDANKNISTINSLTATTIIGTDITGTLQTASQPKITSVSTLDVTAHDGATQGLKLGGVLLTATAAQINSIFGAGGTGTFNDLAVNHNLTIPNADEATQGIVLGETLLTSSGTELNYLDGSLPGTVVASKAVVVDANKDISSFRNLTSVNLTSSAGSLTMGATNISEAEIGVLDAVVPGTTSASKALIVDSSKNIKGINSLMIGSSTDSTRAISVLSNGAAGTTNTITLGQSNTTGNQMEMSYYYSSNGSSSNVGSLGLTGTGSILYVSPQNSGSIGVGQSSPAYKLDVSGTGRFTGNLTLDNAATFTMNATTISESEIAVIDGVTPGTVTASKALVVDATKNIATINSLSANILLGNVITLANNNPTNSFSTWSTPPSPPSYKYAGIAYGNGVYIITIQNDSNTDTNKYIYSTDGINWSVKSSLPTASRWGDVAWLPTYNRFVMISVTSDWTAYSSDGLTWTMKALPSSAAYTNRTSRIMYLSDYQVLVIPPNNIQATVLVSSDGINWTSYNMHHSLPNQYWMSLTQLSQYLTVIIHNNNSNVVTLMYTASPSATFSDLSATTSITFGSVGNQSAIAYSPELDRVVVLNGSTTNTANMIAYKNNPLASNMPTGWTLVNAPVAGLWVDCRWVSSISRFVAVSWDSVTRIIVSADGITWVQSTGTNMVLGFRVLAVGSTVHVIGENTSNSIQYSVATASSAATFTLGSTSIVESEIATIDGVVAGTVSASKAVVVDANKDISSFRNLTATNLTGTIQTTSQPNISSVTALDVTSHDGSTVGLKLGGSLITASADEINYVDNVVPGVVAPAHAVVVDGNKDISSFRNLTSVTLTSTSGSLTMGGTNINETEIAYLDAATPGAALAQKAVVLDTDSSFGGINSLSAPTLTSTNGQLTMGATIINESEIGVIDAVVPGTASPSKAVVLDSSKDVSGIHALSANSFTSTDGSLTMGATNISEFEISALDAVVPGIVSASRAVVVDENKDIATFRNLTALNLTGTLQTIAQPNVTSVGTLDSLSVDGDITAASNIVMGTTTITETIAAELVDAMLGLATPRHVLVTDEDNKLIGLDTLGATTITGTYINGTLQTAAQPLITSVTTLDVTAHDGLTQGLKLGGVLLTATATQINSIFGAGGEGTFADLAVTHNLTLPNADGSTQGIVLGDTLVTSTGTELNYVDTTPGHAQAVKALVVDGARSIDNIHNLTADNLYGTIRTGAQPDITSVTTLDITAHDGLTQGLRLGGELLTATAAQINSIFGAGGEGTFNNLRVNDTLTIANADGSEMGIVLGETLLTSSGVELNYLDGSTPGTATPSNALVLDASRSITNINSLTATTLTGTLQTAAQPNITSVGTLISLAVAGDVTVGSTTLSEAEVAVLDTIVPGLVSPSRAVVVDANKDITSFRNLTAENFIGTLQTAAQPNITSVGELTSLDVAGDVNVGGNLNVGDTFISESEIISLDAAIPGTATATKAMVTDSANNITGINSLTATTLTGTLQTAAQPNITSVGILDSLAVAGNMNCGGTLTVGGTIISESEIVALDAAVPGTAEPLKALITDSTNSIGGIATLSADALVGELQSSNQPNLTSVNTLDITQHDGAEVGLSLGGVLVTATASELNYTDTTPGHAHASKALVFDENIDIDSIHNMSLVGLTSQIGSFTSTTDSSSVSTGALVTAGGAGFAKNLSVGGNVAITGTESITNVTDSSSIATGSLVTAGGVGIAKNLTVGANAAIIGNLNITGTMIQAGSATINNTTDSTVSTNGALIVAGGAGIAKNLNVGVNATVGGTFAVNDATTLTGATLRIKWHAFSLYDITQDKMGCPHTGCAHLHGTNLYHVFWECSAATSLRNHMIRPWHQLGMKPGTVERAIFSMELPCIPPGIWTLAENMLDRQTTSRVEFIEAVSDLVDGCWRIGVAIYLHSVWRWRINHFDELNNVAERCHKAALTTKLRHGYDTVHLHMRKQLPDRFQQELSDLLRRALSRDPTPAPSDQPMGDKPGYLLFFDGGQEETQALGEVGQSL